MCKEFVKRKNTTKCDLMTLCDCCVHVANSGYDCKIKGQNYATALVHAPVKNSKSKSILR